MGLAIHWEFSVETDSAGAARLVRAMRESAQGVGFAEVGEVIEAWADRRVVGSGEVVGSGDGAAGEGGEIAGAGADVSGGGGGEFGTGASDEVLEQVAVDRAWAMSQGLIAVPVEGSPTESVRVAAVHVVAFKAHNLGAEEAAFGLAAYEGMPGYRWTAGCATQGAHKRGGAPAFVRAHRAVVGMLDKARTLGVKVSVRDDGEFWTKRDPKALIDKLDEWESLIVALKTGRRNGPTEPAPRLAAEMRPKIEAARRARPRLDKDPIQELEG